MKQANLIGIIFLCCTFILSGCMKNDTTVSNTEITKKERDVTIYIKESIHLGTYEPLKGVYLGAYVKEDRNINGDIRKFDTLIGANNIFNVFQYDPEERIESREILKCIAQSKTPYIKVYFKSEGDLTPVYRLAMDLKNAYQTPVFIELFPVNSNISNPRSYKETYEKAYKVIREYIKDAVIVWSITDDKAYESMFYYPGHRYVDWVGLNIYIPRYKSGEAYVYDGEEAIDFFYKSFQSSKPMLVSGLAISHFSRMDHTYTIYDTQQKLVYFYDDLLKKYPRIKGILYADIDMGEVRVNGKEDYTLTGQPKLADTMQQLTSTLNIINTLQQENDTKNEGYLCYDITGTFFKNQLYIPSVYMKTLFKKVPLSKITAIEDIKGEKFYAFKDITHYCKCYYKK